jgi:hypothetical protein
MQIRYQGSQSLLDVSKSLTLSLYKVYTDDDGIASSHLINPTMDVVALS